MTSTTSADVPLGPGTMSSELLGAPVRYARGSETPETSLTIDDFRAHSARFGIRPAATGSGAHHLVARIEHAHLSGRGGGHFGVARKWRAHLETGGDALVVANASESEPASMKDKTLLRLRPHIVLDGLVLAAEAIGASAAVVWMHEDARELKAIVSRAIAERPFTDPPEPPIRIATGPHHYLSGESSAIANALSGGPTLPTFRRDRLSRLTVKGQRVLVHNVETLAQVALLARSQDPGHRPSTLLTITEPDRRTVLEVPPSTLLTTVIENVFRGNTPGPPHAVLIGGFGGQWVSWQGLQGMPADDQVLAQHGLSIGAGILMPLSPDQCGVAEATRIARYLADSSAHQCGPCMFGLPAVTELLQEAADLGRGRRNVKKLDRFLKEIAGRGGCSHPDGFVRMVSTAVTVFADDLAEHLKRGRCLHAPGKR